MARQPRMQISFMDRRSRLSQVSSRVKSITGAPHLICMIVLARIWSGWSCRRALLAAGRRRCSSSYVGRERTKRWFEALSRGVVATLVLCRPDGPDAPLRPRPVRSCAFAYVASVCRGAVGCAEGGPTSTRARATVPLTSAQHGVLDGVFAHLVALSALSAASLPQERGVAELPKCKSSCQFCHNADGYFSRRVKTLPAWQCEDRQTSAHEKAA